MADRRGGGGRVRIAPLMGLAGQTSGEAVAVALAARGRAARSVERYAERLGQSRGVAVRAGQMLWSASVGSVMPAACAEVFRKALAGFGANAPVMPPQMAGQAVRDELGGAPREMFAEFDPVPFAAGPVGQVHAAVLPGGRRVAVKLRYLGVEEALRDALTSAGLLAALAPLVRAVAPGVSAAGLRAAAGELCDRVESEASLAAEGARQGEFAAAYAGHPFIRIPAVVPALSARGVLTTDRAEGLGWARALQADDAMRDRWGEVIYRFCVGSVPRCGFCSADPDPGNYLFHADGGVSFLGFKAVSRLGPGPVEAVQRRAQAVAESLLGALRATADVNAIREEWEGLKPRPAGKPGRPGANSTSTGKSP